MEIDFLKEGRNMKERLKKYLVVLISVTMIFTFTGTGVFATGNETDVNDQVDQTESQAVETQTEDIVQENQDVSEELQPKTEDVLEQEADDTSSSLMAVTGVTAKFKGDLEALEITLNWTKDSDADVSKYDVKLIQVNDDATEKELGKTSVEASATEAVFNGIDTTDVREGDATLKYQIDSLKSDGTVATSADGVLDVPVLGKPAVYLSYKNGTKFIYRDKTQDYLRISWKNGGNNDNKSYEIWYKDQNGNSKWFGSVASSATSITKLLTEAQTKYLGNGEKHTFWIRVNNGAGVYLDGKEFQIRALIPSNFDWYAKAKKKITVYKSAKGKKKLTTMKKGATALAIGKYPKKVKGWNVPKRVQVRLSNGKTGWVAWKSVKMIAHVKNHNKFQYSEPAAEAYVKNYSSRTNYLIWVSRYTQRTFVFKGKKGDWELIHDYVCTTANFYQPLYGGEKEIYKHKYRVNKTHSSGKKYYFNYATSFHGSGYFHTRCKWSKSNKLRNSIKVTPSTKGCVRLYDGAAKYIYGLPTNTMVLIH